MHQHPAFRAGLRAALPLALGIAPFGVITGVAMVASGIPPLVAMLMSVVVFAGAPALLIVATTMIINLRFMPHRR